MQTVQQQKKIIAREKWEKSKIKIKKLCLTIE